MTERAPRPLAALREDIGANAVVRDDVPAGALVGGVPARVLRS